MTSTPNEPFPTEATSSTDEPSWGSAPSAPPTGARFFDRVRGLRIVRPDTGRWAAGVAAGIARRYGIDPVVVRIAFIVLTLFGGFGVLVYGLGWLLLPHPDGRVHAQQVLLGSVTAGFLGALLTVLVATPHWLPFLAIALIVWMIATNRRTHRDAAC